MKRDYAKTGMSAKGDYKRKKWTRYTKPTVGQIVQREILKTAEMKENNSFASNTVSTTSGTVVVLNFIGEGDDANNRNGRKITTRAIDVKYRYLSTSANALSSAQVALVYDATPAASVATYATIFDTSSASAGISFKNTLNNKDRFKVFWMDELPESNGSDSTNGYTHRKRHYTSLKHFEAFQRTGYGATAASTPNTGGWYLCFGDTLNTTSQALITYNVKYQYTDA